jgi:hypothetical protein
MLDPGVIEYFDEGNSHCRFTLKEFVNEVFIVWGALGTEFEVPLHNFITYFYWLVAL